MGAGLPTEGTNAQHPRLADVARRDVPVCSLGERLGDVRDRHRAILLQATQDFLIDEVHGPSGSSMILRFHILLICMIKEYNSNIVAFCAQI